MKKRQDVAWGFFYGVKGRTLDAFHSELAAIAAKHGWRGDHNPGPIFRITPPAKPKRNPYALTGIAVVKTITFPDWKIRVNGTTKKKGKK